MYKKLLVLCLALAMASAAFGEVTVMIGDFESGMGDWYVSAPCTGIVQSTYGVTEGSQALAVWMGPDAEGQNNFQWMLHNDNMWAYYGEPASGILGLYPNAYMTLDITWVAAEWYDDMDDGSMWANQQLLAVNSNPGWGQFNPVDTANPSYPGSWDPYNWGAVHTRELKYELSNYDLPGSAGAWWMQFILSSNWDGTGIVTPGAFYIDNIVLHSPEPATIAMLGIGALALIRKRK